MPRLEKAAGGRLLPPMVISTGYGALAPIGTLMLQVNVSGSPGPVTLMTNVPLPGAPGVPPRRPPRPPAPNPAPWPRRPPAGAVVGPPAPAGAAAGSAALGAVDGAVDGGR